MDENLGNEIIYNAIKFSTIAGDKVECMKTYVKLIWYGIYEAKYVSTII